jgi:hypothetical protein
MGEKMEIRVVYVVRKGEDVIKFLQDEILAISCPLAGCPCLKMNEYMT